MFFTKKRERTTRIQRSSPTSTAKLTRGLLCLVFAMGLLSLQLETRAHTHHLEKLHKAINVVYTLKGEPYSTQKLKPIWECLARVHYAIRENTKHEEWYTMKTVRRQSMLTYLASAAADNPQMGIEDKVPKSQLSCQQLLEEVSKPPK